MRTWSRNACRRAGVLAVALAVAHCGDSSVTFVPGDGDPDPGTTTIPTVTPGQTAAPGTPAPAPTPTAGGVPPTAVPTEPPSGATCAAGDMVTVMVDLGTGGIGLAGAQITLDYVPPASLPGSIDAASVAERVTIIPSVGFTSVNDQDTQPDGVDDRLNVSVVAGAAFAEGPFADVVFDCDAGGAVPTAASFGCNAEGSDEFGGLVTTACTLTLSGP